MIDADPGSGNRTLLATSLPVPPALNVGRWTFLTQFIARVEDFIRLRSALTGNLEVLRGNPILSSEEATGASPNDTEPDAPGARSALYSPAKHLILAWTALDNLIFPHRFIYGFDDEPRLVQSVVKRKSL